MKLMRSIHLPTLLFLALLSSQLVAGEVSIAVAANFTDVARKIAILYKQASGHICKLSYGSTGKLFSQIEQGAPFEVFLAADTQRPRKAESEGLAVAGSRFTYAKGKLVLWSADKKTFDDGKTYLVNADYDHLAIANPMITPYGAAARQVMQSLDVWLPLQSKLVRGDSIAQTFQFVATGNASAGFVALSQIKTWKGEPGTLWEIPADYYSPIEQAAVLLQKGASNPAAVSFLDFLKGRQSREVIASYGYEVD